MPQPVDDASRALAAGDVPDAVTSYTRFDDRWADVEEGVRLSSRDRYREIESAIIEVRQALLKPAEPDPAAAAAALGRLRQVIDSALPALQ